MSIDSLSLPNSSLFAALALAVSALVVLGLNPIAGRLGLLDRPDDFLKDHGRDTPITGGIAVFLGLHVAMAVGQEFDLGLFALTSVFLVIGLFDDIKGLSPLIRLAAAGIGGIGMVFLLDAQGDLLAAILVVALFVVALNAVNLLDGADGVAGSATLVTALGLAFLALFRDTEALGPLFLAGAVAGFLIFNWPKAKVFLGDGGAYVVGASLAYFVVGLAGEPVAFDSTWLPRVLVAGSMFGVFGVDLVVTLLRRVIARQPLFGGDRSHVYDQLATEGWSPVRVAGAVAIVQIGVVVLVLLFDVVFAPWVAAILSLFLVHGVITALCALGFASRRQAPADEPDGLDSAGLNAEDLSIDPLDRLDH